jgi:hypothetical protein
MIHSHIHVPVSSDILCLRPDWHSQYQSRQLHIILSHFSAPPTLTTEFPQPHLTATYLSFPRHTKEPGYRSRYSDSLRSGLSGDRFSVGAKFSAPVQTSGGAHPVCCKMGAGSLPRRQSGRCVALTTLPNLGPRLNKEYSCSTTLLWTLTVCCGVNFNLFFKHTQNCCSHKLCYHP